jgi:integrase/recombinase XerD
MVTLALDAGVSLLRDVQDAARHADPRTTRRYDRARHAPERHATYTLAAFIAEVLPSPACEDQPFPPSFL